MARPIDITAPLGASTPRFPGDPEIRVTTVRSLERGDPYRLCALSMGSHSGTHVDAPSHFIPDGDPVDAADLGLLCGPAVVAQLPEGARSIGRAEVEALPEGTRRVLFRTANSARWAGGSGFFPEYVSVDRAGAEALVARGIGLVGVDGPSVETDPTLKFPVHHRLLGSGTWIIEAVRLDGVAPGRYELTCLPLRLTGADGAPCRAVLWA